MSLYDIDMSSASDDKKRRRVHFDEPTTKPPASKRPRTAKQRKQNTLRKASGVSKRPKDVFIEPATKQTDKSRSSSEPVKALFDIDVKVEQPEEEGRQEERDRLQTANETLSEPIGADSYLVTQRYMYDSILKAGDFDDPDAEAASQNVNSALMRAQQKREGTSAAAYTNHMIRLVGAERALGGSITQLATTPYTNNTLSFAQNFISAMIECSPDAAAHEILPSEEVRARSQFVPRAYIEKYQRTARVPHEYACARQDHCFGMELYDAHCKKLPGTVWRAFWFPDEEREVERNPDAFKEEANQRLCIGCKIKDANMLRHNVLARNNRVDPTVLATDFHVLVDVPGEYPVTATIGRCTNGHIGFANNVPRSSAVGWSSRPDGQLAGCYTYRTDIPRSPIDKAYYDRDTKAASGASGF